MPRRDLPQVASSSVWVQLISIGLGREAVLLLRRVKTRLARNGHFEPTRACPLSVAKVLQQAEGAFGGMGGLICHLPAQNGHCRPGAPPYCAETTRELGDCAAVKSSGIKRPRAFFGPAHKSAYGTKRTYRHVCSMSANGMDPPCSCPSQPHSWFGATEPGAFHATQHQSP